MQCALQPSSREMIGTGGGSKGKQNTRGQKQIHEENVATMKYYASACVVSSLLYMLVVYFALAASTWEWLGFGISVCIQCAAITVMRKMAIATKNEKGQLIDAGLDLNQEGGFGEYCKDAVILTSIVDCLALFWGKFFLFLLLVPAYAFYKLWVGILAPYFFAPSMQTDDVDEKKQRKRERVKMKRI